MEAYFQNEFNKFEAQSPFIFLNDSPMDKSKDISHPSYFRAKDLLGKYGILVPERKTISPIYFIKEGGSSS